MTGRIVNTIKAAKDIYLNTEEAYERVKVCESCDKYLKMAKICGECKCFIPAKSRLRYANCPINKWVILDGISS